MFVFRDCHKPVSKNVRDFVLQAMQGKKLTPNMLGVKAGSRDDEIVAVTTEGDVPCVVRVSPSFVCLYLAGRNNEKPLGIPKEHFPGLSRLLERQPH